MKEQAHLNNRSLEAEASTILEERADGIDALVDDLEAFHHRMVAKHGYLPDSTPLIREMRVDC